MRIKNLIWILGFFLYVSFAYADDTRPILNMSTNNATANATIDYSIYNKQFSYNGNVTQADNSVCKWYTCIDFNKAGDTSDYLNSSSNVNWSSQIEAEFWIYVTQAISGANGVGIFQYGTGGGLTPDTLKSMRDDAFGMKVDLKTNNSAFSRSAGEAYETPVNQWTHYVITYNSGNVLMWQNAILILNYTDNSYGVLNSTTNELLRVGRDAYWGFDGYMDELIVRNSTVGIDQTYVSNLYSSQRLGTPKTNDLIFKQVKYKMEVNDSKVNNHTKLSSGVMQINVTMMNDGVNNTNNFNYSCQLDGVTFCSGVDQLNANSNDTAICNWTISKGYHIGNCTVDFLNNVTEDIETNNVQRLYVSYLDEPFFPYTSDEWRNLIIPFSSNTSNAAAYDSYNWVKTFAAMGDFSNSYTCDQMDPYSNNLQQAAQGCYLSNFTGTTVCGIAKNHLFGWLNRSLSTCTNVQSVVGLGNIGRAYKLLYNNLSNSDRSLLSKEGHDMCQWWTNIANVRPDLDNTSLIKGDNGAGFGASIGLFCREFVGEYTENPTMMQQLPSQAWGKNIPDMFSDRIVNYLRAFKNDSYSQYQEGLWYKYSSQLDLIEDSYFMKRYGIYNGLSDYQAAFCSMGRESIQDILDFTYNGNSLLGDTSQTMRMISRGDTHSYQDYGSNSVPDYARTYEYGLLCDDLSVKKELLYFGNYTYTKDTNGHLGYYTMFLYPMLYNQTNGIMSPPNLNHTRIFYDNNNDIFSIRTNYTYSNDTIIQIDGGEEKGTGHSHAQGYFVYALGEPWLDYTQVPYEDDVRDEWWKNGVSLQTKTQTVEGTGGTYSATCGNAPLNQYYGMQDCPKLGYPQDYPDGRNFPIQYGGDVEDYMGTSDASLAGAFKWISYKNADPVRYYFIKFGNLLVVRAVVSGNTEGKGVQYHLVKLQNITNYINQSLNVTFYNGTKNFETDLMYSNQSMQLAGGNTTINACFMKTGCTGSNRAKSDYLNFYYNTSSNDIDLILGHHWFYTGERQSLDFINGTNKGLSQENNKIIFDTDNNGYVNYSNKNATGWGLAFNDATKEYAAFNSTFFYNGSNYLWTANESMEVHMQANSGQIIMTINNMQRRIGIDYPRQTTLTVNTTFLTNSSGISTKSTTFNVTGAQIPVVYTITANSSDYLVRDMTGALLGAGEAGKEETPVATVTRGITFGTGSGIRFGNGGRMIW